MTSGTRPGEAPATSAEEVAAIFDPFGNAVHTALAFPVLGEDVLITGAGPIGLFHVALARLAGAAEVLVALLRQLFGTWVYWSAPLPEGTVQRVPLDGARPGEKLGHLRHAHSLGADTGLAAEPYEVCNSLLPVVVYVFMNLFHGTPP